MAIDKAASPDQPEGGDELEVEVAPDAISIAQPDGGAIVLFGDEQELDITMISFDSNLAEVMDDDVLDGIADELIEAYEADKSSRKDWEKAYIKGLDLLGIRYEDRSIPWEGACGVFHPMMTEAVVRFQSQAIMEIFPAAGPVRTEIVGRSDYDTEKAARRVEGELNYQLTEKMPEFRPETERMLFGLPLSGSTFKKTYYDPSLGRATSLYVPAEDFIASYGATDLRTCPRYTHRMRKYPNDVRKFQVAGFYRDIDLPEPQADYSEIEEREDKLIGIEASVEVDDRLQILEMHVDWDLEGFEDRDVDTGEPTGIALPYVVTIEKQSGKILSIYRNWAEGDHTHLKRQHFTKYDYIPGIGFYSYGLIHLMGGLTKSATSILRQLIDAGTLSNLPAGLKTRGLRIKGDDSPIMPGEFRDVDVPSGAIKDNITFLPYKEPSQVLAKLLEGLVDEGRRIGSVADMHIGAGNQEAPVGTTLALIERAMKIMSAVQARLHYSLKHELKLVAAIIRDQLPDDYEYPTDDGAVRKTDFEKVDIIPVSDPNAASLSQRVSQYQAALQLAAQAPTIYKLPVLHRQFLDVLGIQNADKIVPVEDDLKPTDPVTENMAILKMEPVKAFLTQDHESHIQVHMNAVQDPKIKQLVGQSPMAGAIMAAMSAHVQEHVGFAYRHQIEQQLGAPLPDPKEHLPEDVEVQLSKLIADASGKLLAQNQGQAAQQQAMQQAQDPVLQLQKQELQLKAQDQQQKASNAQAKLALETQKAQDKRELELARIQSHETVSGAQIGAQSAHQNASNEAKLKQISSREQVDGARIGAENARHRADISSKELTDGHRIGIDIMKDQKSRATPPVEGQ